MRTDHARDQAARADFTTAVAEFVRFDRARCEVTANAAASPRNEPSGSGKFGWPVIWCLSSRTGTFDGRSGIPDDRGYGIG